MDSSFIYLILTILTFSVALNLALTFAVFNWLRNMSMAKDLPFTLPIGEKVPDVECRLLTTGESVLVSGKEQAVVLLFLSSTCPKCREKLPEIERLLPLSRVAGLSMRLVSQEAKWRLRRFLIGTSLPATTILANKRDYKTLNPTQTSPYYLFIDHAGHLEAGGFIGDENWLSFLVQMDGIDTTAMDDK